MFNPTRPYLWYLVYLLLVYLRPQEYADSSLATVPLYAITLALAAGLWLLRGPRRLDAPQLALLPLFLLAMMLSVMVNGWMGGALDVLTQFAPIALLMFMTASLLDTPAKMRMTMLAIAAATTFIALHCIGQSQAPDGIGWSGARTVEDGRVTYVGILNDPNDLAVAFLIALPMTLQFAAELRWKLLRLVPLAAAGCLLYGIYLTNSRGGELALMVMAGAYSVRRYGWKLTLVVAPMLILPPLLLLPSRLDTISTDDESAAGRIDAWYEGFDMFRHHPLLGVGKGNFTDYNQLTAHNSYILAISELGLVGYFLWLSLLLITAVMAWRVLHADEPPDADAAGRRQWDGDQRSMRTLGSGLIGFLFAILFLSRTYFALLYLLQGLIIAQYLNVRARWPALAPVRFRTVGRWLLPLEFGSIIGLYLLTRVLLQLA